MTNLPIVETPRFWNLVQWIINPLALLDRCASRYGDCFQLQMGKFQPFILFSHPEAIEQIFTTPPDCFDSGRANHILRQTLGDNSLLILDGDRHQRQRQLLMPPFHGDRMRAYGQTICQITTSIAQTWKPNTVFAARPAMQAISLQVILSTVFGIQEGDRFQQLEYWLNRLLQLTTTRIGFTISVFPVLQTDLGDWSPGGQLRHCKAQIDRLLYAEIGDRRAHPEADSTDILSLLLAARDDAGQPMTNLELRDELMTLLVAGHETTATAIAWALYWIHALPEVKTKVLDELATLGENPEPMAIARLPYLNAVCSETLRIYPIGFVTQMRIPKQPVTILDHTFAPDSFLLPCIYLTHHRPDLYPEPDRFRPDRFLERQFSPFEYFPFGGSNRRCIGAAFALFELKLVLATLLAHFTFELAERGPVQPVRRGVTIAPGGGVRLRKTMEPSQRAQLATSTV